MNSTPSYVECSCGTFRISIGIQRYRKKTKKNSMKTKEKKSHETKPSAFIVSPRDKGRKSIKSGNIYLDDKEEFQIELFNPLKECVLADIRLNGQSISKSGLVIKPGQRVYLDCFIEDKKKFIFQTYEVEISGEVEKAIENNGLMEVFFYKEEVQSLKNWSEKLREVVIRREYYPIYVDRYPYWYPWWYGSNITTLGDTNYTNNGNITLTNGTMTYSSNLINCSNSTSLYSTNINYSDSNSNPQINLRETGRIEKGGKSNQEFTEVDMNFEKNYIHSIVYQLLPNSLKPIEVETRKDLKVNHDFTDLLVKLKDLKDADIITESEFQEKKKELLARI